MQFGRGFRCGPGLFVLPMTIWPCTSGRTGTGGPNIASFNAPLAAPAFAVMRGVEQPVDQPLVGVGRGVREEGLDLGGRRRQPGKIETGAAQQRDPFGFGREAESQLRQRVHEERIDRRAGAVFGFRRGLADGAAGPWA